MSFVIPINAEDLLNESDKYFHVESAVVDDGQSFDEILKPVEDSLKEDQDASPSDPLQITQHATFDPLYCLIMCVVTRSTPTSINSSSRKSSQLPMDVKTNLFLLLVKYVKTVTTIVGDFLGAPGDEEDDSTHAQQSLRNALKMVVFLLQWFISQEEVKFAKGKGKAGNAGVKVAQRVCCRLS